MILRPAVRETVWDEADPTLLALFHPQVWVRAAAVRPFDPASERSTTDPDVLSGCVTQTFRFRGEIAAVPSPDFPPAEYALTDRHGRTYRLRLAGRNAVELPDFADRRFQVAFGADQLSVALLERPPVMPEESVLVKTMDAGLVVVDDRGTRERSALCDPRTIRRAATVFWQAKREETPASSIGANPRVVAKFYRYGEETTLSLYPEGARLETGGDVRTFRMNAADVEAVRSALKARTPVTVSEPWEAEPFAKAAWTRLEIRRGDERRILENAEWIRIPAVYEEVAFAENAGGPLEPFEYVLTDQKGSTFRIRVLAENIVEFPDALPGKSFQTDPVVSAYGYAFLSKPAFLPEASWESVATGNALAKVESGPPPAVDKPLWLTARNRAVAYAFFAGRPKPVAPPEQPGDESESITFYRFGEQVRLRLYEEYVRVEFGKTELWFRMDRENIRNIHMAYAAG
ncbi:MAG: hypothetical protein BLM47_06930 [Candidatus Reconcilbacillus cellulovorans]|uniref:DUF4340 domain-containing protein n=1 Tax=Candidatus Reconcilbacillus cellulovorans TaxID=1906605 RepID=A0A2A6E0A2_9BACL|nr:MAG: hypothetical protein BLM47_06930 [Candidatus Reconcilbacillus cellulovorans]